MFRTKSGATRHAPRRLIFAVVCAVLAGLFSFVGSSPASSAPTPSSDGSCSVYTEQHDLNLDGRITENECRSGLERWATESRPEPGAPAADFDGVCSIYTEWHDLNEDGLITEDECLSGNMVVELPCEGIRFIGATDVRPVGAVISLLIDDVSVPLGGETRWLDPTIEHNAKFQVSGATLLEQTFDVLECSPTYPVPVVTTTQPTCENTVPTFSGNLAWRGAIGYRRDGLTAITWPAAYASVEGAFTVPLPDLGPGVTTQFSFFFQPEGEDQTFLREAESHPTVYWPTDSECNGEQYVDLPTLKKSDPCNSYRTQRNAVWIRKADTAQVDFTYYPDRHATARTKQPGQTFESGETFHDYGIPRDSGVMCKGKLSLTKGWGWVKFTNNDRYSVKVYYGNRAQTRSDGAVWIGAGKSVTKKTGRHQIDWRAIWNGGMINRGDNVLIKTKPGVNPAQNRGPVWPKF
jgi:hypothetical protein